MVFRVKVRVTYLINLVCFFLKAISRSLLTIIERPEYTRSKDSVPYIFGIFFLLMASSLHKSTILLYWKQTTKAQTTHNALNATFWQNFSFNFQITHCNFPGYNFASNKIISFYRYNLGSWHKIVPHAIIIRKVLFLAKPTWLDVNSPYTLNRIFREILK